MITKPLVTVVMATYNGENYLSEQINSILGQTYSNLEIIITDDASTDGTMAILRDFQEKNNSIKIFSNPVNLGINSSFEKSIRNSRGEYIAISDQDDIWETNKIESLMNAIENEDAIFSDSELVDKYGSPLNIKISSLVNLQSFNSGLPFLMGICLPGHSLILQGDFARYILPIPRVIMYDRWISYCAGANNGIKYLPKTLVKYRQHETNCFGVGKARNKKDQKTKMQKFHTKLMELKACEQAPVRDAETKKILQEMLTLFNRKPSFQRSLFFFRNRNKLMVIKKRNRIRKLLYCMKMFFKANY